MPKARAASEKLMPLTQLALMLCQVSGLIF
jgi:hypothetical protein